MESEPWTVEKRAIIPMRSPFLYLIGDFSLFYANARAHLWSLKLEREKIAKEKLVLWKQLTVEHLSCVVFVQSKRIRSSWKAGRSTWVKKNNNSTCFHLEWSSALQGRPWRLSIGIGKHLLDLRLVELIHLLSLHLHSCSQSCKINQNISKTLERCNWEPKHLQVVILRPLFLD